MGASNFLEITVCSEFIAFVLEKIHKFRNAIIDY